MLRSLSVAKNNIKMQSVLTFVSILTGTITFFLLTCFLAFALLSNFLLGFLESRSQVTVYFRDSVEESSIVAIRDELSNMSEVSQARYTSKEEALEIFVNMFKTEPLLTDNVEAGVLPASIDIWVTNIDDLDKVTEYVKEKEGIEEIVYFEEALQTFKQWSDGIKMTGIILISLLLLQSFLIVLVVTAVTIRDMSEEIRIMRLLGATSWYIQGPFFAQSAIISFLSSLFSVVMFMAVIPFAEPFVLGSFSGVPIPALSFLAVGALFLVQLTINLLLSFAGTFVALKKYLTI